MTKDVPINEILPPEESYKYDKGEFERLKESIKNNGLFHNIILQESIPYGALLTNEIPFYRIIAGRARFLAWKELNKEEDSLIPATILPFDCPNPHEISLHENLRRNNLPWYDQVELEKELHELRISVNGQAKSHRPTDGKKTGWSYRDTANELGLSLGMFSQDMALATELARNPNL